MTVSAPGGHFEFSALAFQDRNTLVASVRNETPHEWLIARFEFRFFDGNGRAMNPREPLMDDIIGIPPGGNERFETFVRGVDGRRVARIDINFLPSSKKTPRFVVRIVKPESRPEASLETEHVAVRFIVTRDEFGMSLRNTSDVPIQLDWNTASLVDTDGKAHRVIRDGVRLVDRDKPQLPSIIPPGAAIEARIVSVGSIEHDRLMGREMVRPFFQVTEETAPQLKGKSLSLLLPLVIEEKTQQLFITFLIEDVIL